MNTTIAVKGMSCNHCVMAVKKALMALDGVTDAQVDLGKGQATFEHDRDVDMTALKDGIERAGFELG